MPIPSYDGTMLPLLQLLRDGGEHDIRELRDKMAAQFTLREDERRQLNPSDRQAIFDNRVGWGKTYLEKAVLLATVKRGTYRITDAGKVVLSENPTRIDKAYLMRFESFRDFIERADDEDAPTVPIPPQGTAPGITPEESLEKAYREIRHKVEGDLLEAVLKASPSFFEKLVVELLAKMGYGGTLEDAGRALGRSHDGGLDGIIKEDHLGLDAIYVQAKRWQNSVGRPDVQAFAGSLEGERARKGVFITTSKYSCEARDYVRKIEKKIVLIDGPHLASLMVDFGIGVNLVSTYQVVRVDSDYFSEE